MDLSCLNPYYILSNAEYKTSYNVANSKDKMINPKLISPLKNMLVINS